MLDREVEVETISPTEMVVVAFTAFDVSGFITWSWY